MAVNVDDTLRLLEYIMCVQSTEQFIRLPQKENIIFENSIDNKVKNQLKRQNLR